MPEVKTCPECRTEIPADAPDGSCPRCAQLREAMTTPPSLSDVGTSTPTFRGIFTPPSVADLAPHFPQLEIIELLGQGGMGAVYKARQPGLDRLVAVKILPPEAGSDTAFAERFTREARALAKLNHPNIITVYDFGQTGGYFYFVMEFADGLNLRQLIRRGRIPPDETLKIVPQVCDALQYAHEERFVHRDIKPENILLDKKGRVKIADFGIAKLLGRTATDYTLTGPWQVMGTLHYMAPEQMDAPLKVDHRADIYSLGVVFYEMLTGQLPLGRFQPPSQKVPLDARLDNVVLRALENEPDRRYQRASEVKTDVAIITGQFMAPPTARLAETTLDPSVTTPFASRADEQGDVILTAQPVTFRRSDPKNSGTSVEQYRKIRPIPPIQMESIGCFMTLIRLLTILVALLGLIPIGQDWFVVPKQLEGVHLPNIVGHKIWQGLSTSIALFMLGCLLIVTFSRTRMAIWRAAIVLSVAIAVAVVCGYSIASPPTVNVRLNETPDFVFPGINFQPDKIKIGGLEFDANKPISLNSEPRTGPYFNLVVAFVLILFGCIETRQAIIAWSERRKLLPGQAGPVQ